MEKYMGWNLEKVRVRKSSYAPKGVEWRACKKNKCLQTQPTKEALKRAIRLSEDLKEQRHKFWRGELEEKVFGGI